MDKQYVVQIFSTNRWTNRTYHDSLPEAIDKADVYHQTQSIDYSKIRILDRVSSDDMSIADAREHITQSPVIDETDSLVTQKQPFVVVCRVNGEWQPQSEIYKRDAAIQLAQNYATKHQFVHILYDTDVIWKSY